MRVTLERTSRIIELIVNGQAVPARSRCEVLRMQAARRRRQEGSPS